MKSLLVLPVLFLISINAAANTWQWHGSCYSYACTQVRGDSIGEYCNRQSVVLNKYLEGKNLPPIELIESRVYSFSPSSPNSFTGQGLCRFSGNVYEWAAFYPSTCPLGQTYNPVKLRCVDKKRDRCKVGNPVEVDSGLKVQKELDHQYVLAANQFVKVFRSYIPKINLATKDQDNASYGGYWAFSYTDKLSLHRENILDVNEYFATTSYGDTGGLVFSSYDNSVWENLTGSSDRLERILVEGISSWKLTQSNGITKFFDISGSLQKINDPNIGKLDLIYRVGLYQGVPSKFVDLKLNNNIIFTYRYENENLVQLLSNDVPVANYHYDTLGNLTKVDYSIFTDRVYLYEDLNFHKLLTGIIDERGIRYSTWVYDNRGRAISSEHADGAEKTLLAFNSDGSTTVTNALNKQTIYRFADIAGARRVTKVEGQPTTNCIGANQDYTYTAEGWIASKTDWKGIQTTFTYNTAGQEISRTEAFGTPEARTITTEWHSTLFVKTKITEPGKETVYSYDANGRLLNQSTQSIAVQ